MLESFRRGAFLGVALACAACGDDDAATHHEKADSGPSVTDAGPPESGTDASRPNDDDGGAAPNEGGAPTPVADAGDASLPNNDSFDTARPIVLGGKREFEDLRKPQKSYFSFQGKEGGFYEFMSFFGPYAPDNTLRLYDSDRTLLAENQSGERWPGDTSTDTRLVVRLPKGGTYYLEFEDPALVPESFPDAYTEYFFYVSARELTPGTSGAGFESQDADFATDATSGYLYTTLVGTFRDGEDGVFKIPGVAGQALIGQVLPSGVPGNGSTATGGIAQVTSPKGDVLASIERDRGQSDIHPPIGEGSYDFTMTASGDLGDNGFFAVDLVMLPENPVVEQTPDNVTIAGAEPIQMLGTIIRRGLMITTIPAAEVHYYSFAANAGETILAACEAESAGSGIRSLHADLRDANDKVIATTAETPIENAYVPTTTVQDTGTYYLRLTTEAASSTVVDPWVRCVVNIGR
jgi:hypothetical protein